MNCVACLGSFILLLTIRHRHLARLTFRHRSGNAAGERRARHVVARAWGPARARRLRQSRRSSASATIRPLVPLHAVVADRARRLPGLRLTSGAPLFETLLFSILGQKVTSFEARRSFAALIRRFGEPRPGRSG